MNNIINGDCLEQLKDLEDNSVDAIITDPPYGISFMGKKWDYDVPKVEVWQECLRVLKAGGHILVACGTRTQHRMAVNIEDAGFEIRDIVAWVYGSGFPKSHNIGKSVDKLQGNEREVIGNRKAHDIRGNALMEATVPEYKKEVSQIQIDITKGTSEYEGWGTALKPAMELWTLARKPLSEKTIAKNVLKWGTGGLNIDGCRVGTSEQDKYDLEQRQISKGSGKETNINFTGRDKDLKHGVQKQGRFPANLIHDGSDEVVGLFPDTKSGKGGLRTSDGFNVNAYGKGMGIKAGQPNGEFGDSGSAARFFYCAKASKSERNAGLEGFDDVLTHGHYAQDEWSRQNMGNTPDAQRTPTKNNHPTVKPIKLMQYLVRLITPKGGTVLDPYMGSGTTGIACIKGGFDFIGIEKEKEYIEIARARINHFKKSNLN